MTNAEYAEFERQRERTNWQRLIDINLLRKPTTFEQNECEDMKKNPEFMKMYRATEQKAKMNGQMNN